jgi:hypothetical protein
MVVKCIRQKWTSRICVLLTASLFFPTWSWPDEVGAEVQDPSLRVSAAKKSGPRKVWWLFKGGGYSFQYQKCWRDYTEKLFHQKIPSFAATASCPKSEDTSWKIMLNFPNYGINNRDFFDPKDGEYSQSMTVRGVQFDIYHRTSSEYNMWIAVTKISNHIQISPTYMEPLSKSSDKPPVSQKMPKSFADFVSTIRLKSEKEYDMREKNGRALGKLEDVRADE